MKTQQESITTVKDETGALCAIIYGQGSPSPIIYVCTPATVEQVSEIISNNI